MSDQNTDTKEVSTNSTSTEGNLILGEYKTIEAAEKGYKELKAEFTRKSQELAEIKKSSSTTTKEEKVETKEVKSDVASLYKAVTAKITGEVAEKGIEGLTPETIKEALDTGRFSDEADFKEHVQRQIDKANAKKAELQEIVGKNIDLKELVEWSKTKYSEEERSAFNTLLEKGRPEFMAILAEQYAKENKVANKKLPVKKGTNKDTSTEGPNEFLARKIKENPRYIYDVDIRNQVRSEYERRFGKK